MPFYSTAWNLIISSILHGTYGDETVGITSRTQMEDDSWQVLHLQGPIVEIVYEANLHPSHERLPKAREPSYLADLA